MTFRKLGVLTLVLTLALLPAAACVGNNRSGSSDVTVESRERSESVLAKVNREKVLRVGFSGYPPYLSIDPVTKQPSGGFSVDLIQAILQEWDKSIKIEWVPTNWTNVRTDLVVGKFDLIVEPVFRTIPRAAVVDFSRPFAYFGYAIGVVQANERRFKSIEDINRPDVSIAVGQGLSSHEYVRRHLAKATNLKVVPGGQAQAALEEVLLRRVDIALSDTTTIQQYLKAHPDRLKVVFADPPPARVAAGLMFRQGDYRFASFLNITLDYLETSGELGRLKQKHGITE
jgi:cyclohexadienyl dehydratase